MNFILTRRTNAPPLPLPPLIASLVFVVVVVLDLPRKYPASKAATISAANFFDDMIMAIDEWRRLIIKMISWRRFVQRAESREQREEREWWTKKMKMPEGRKEKKRGNGRGK